MTEQQPDSQLVLVVYVITFIFGLPANTLALFTFIKKVRQNATPVDVLLLNLTVSDLVFLLFLPFRMKEAVDGMKWHMPYFLCPMSGYIFYTTIYNSSFMLTGISVERYLGVAFPIKYKLKRRPRYAAIFVFVAWAFSLSHCSIVYIMQYYDHVNATAIDPSDRDTCYEEFTPAQLTVLLPVRLELCIVLFCVPLVICTFCYANFIRILSGLPNITRRKRQRAIGLAVGTMLVFLLCFGPYNISHLVGYATWKSPHWRKYAVLTSTFNTCLDPFIYYFSSSALRATFRHVMRRMCDRLHLRTGCCRALYCPLLTNSCMEAEDRTGTSNDSSAQPSLDHARHNAVQQYNNNSC
ncbi:free fatty acid receptor 2-like [Engraulis encrasicolus]|uniref:free fatty acid receptor 2-like n=1 Tax=Engraulis encrasicolus TaxID=184585 RepID=UPI002FCF3B92